MRIAVGGCTLLLATSVAAFGGLTARVDPFRESAEGCRDELDGSTAGLPWYRCVIDRLNDLQQIADYKGEEPALGMPMVPYLFDPLRPHPSFAKFVMEDFDKLKTMMRNFSCDSPGGSEPVSLLNWQHAEPENVCDPASGRDQFYIDKGFLPTGHDLDLAEVGKRLTEDEAKDLCAANEKCKGFTYLGQREAGARFNIIFKTDTNGKVPHHDWNTVAKKSSCIGSRWVGNLTVQVFQEESATVPAVYVVDDFATDAECQSMMDETIPHMSRSVVAGMKSGISEARRSYSQNMYPNFVDAANTHTRIARRLLAFARQVGGYQLNETGQEPINAVYYKDPGDEYKNHCDGGCDGREYRIGHRVATALLYCQAADKGGYTMFSRTGVKVVGKRGRLLFFGYKLKKKKGDNFIMDPGYSEHTGCPLRAGKKWIATMWFREGVSEQYPWSTVSGV